MGNKKNHGIISLGTMKAIGQPNNLEAEFVIRKPQDWMSLLFIVGEGEQDYWASPNVPEKGKLQANPSA